MAKVKHFNDTAVWAYSSFDRYKIEKSNSSTITMVFNESERNFNREEAPWQIKLSIKNARQHTVESGGSKGEKLYKSGKVTKVTFQSDSGEKLVQISDISASLAFFSSLVLQDNLNGFYHYLVAGGSTFSNAGDVETGFGDDIVRSRDSNWSYIKDRGGQDKYIGGSNFDTVSYDQWYWTPGETVSGINADLAKGRVKGPDGHTDSLKSIEGIRGTFLDDVIRGNKQDNRLMGHQGDDLIDGRGGFDTVRYDRDQERGGPDRVKVDLKKGTARDGYGNVDKLKNIEGAIGTDQNDIFRDNNKDNYFDGEGGNDSFRLTKGDDYTRGGEGNDKFIFVGNNFGFDRIEDFNANGERDKIKISKAKNLSDLKLIQDGNDAIIRLNRDSEVRLENYNVNDLSANDFIF